VFALISVLILVQILPSPRGPGWPRRPYRPLAAKAAVPPGRRSGRAAIAAATVNAVPRYEFRCRECSTTFEVDRPMSASGLPASCPSGHDDTVRLLSVLGLARGGAGRGGAIPAPAPARAGGGGGCCGGGCCG
jgi:putative FmdB family regulatory protein